MHGQPCQTKSPTAGVEQRSPAVVVAANRPRYWDKMFDVDGEDQSRAGGGSCSPNSPLEPTRELFGSPHLLSAAISSQRTLSPLPGLHE